MRGRVWIAVVGACLAAAAPAQAAEPERTITALNGSYDVASGAISATVTFGAAPTPALNAIVGVFAGRWSGATCADDVLLVATSGGADPAGVWAFADDLDTTYPSAPRAASGSAITLAATDTRLAGKDYDCLWARAIDPFDDGTTVEYSRSAFVDLTVTQPPPPPAPTPTPTPAPTPAPTPVQVPKTAKLALTVEGVRPMKRNRWLPVRVKVANVGGATARKVTLRAKPARGAKASKRRVKVGTLKAGKARTVRLKLRTKRKASVALTARSGKVRASEKLPLVLRGRVVKPPKAGLGGTYFTLWTADPMGPGRRHGYAFVDDRWAYRGIPKGGLPTCTAKTAGTDEDGEPTDGCLPYTFDRKTRELKIDGQAAALSADGAQLDVGEDTYWLTPIVKPGTTFTLSLKSIYVSGWWPYQSVTTTWLEMSAEGAFMLSGQTLGSFGVPGTIGSGNWASIPPDQRGTYAVLPGGKLRLTYSDGKVEERTIGIYRDAKTGSADPATDGLWLDDDPFWKDGDE